MFNRYFLYNKDIEDIKEIETGYCWSKYRCFIKIKYNKWWKLSRTFKFYDYDEANQMYSAITKLIK
jgi:hypothetical protein